MLMAFPFALLAHHTTEGGLVLSKEVDAINGSFDFNVKYFFGDSTYMVVPPVFSLPDNFQDNYSGSGTNLYVENDSIEINFGFTYNTDSIPYYPQKLEIVFQSYYYANNGDTVYQDILATAMVYFTPYNTIEVWSLSDFQDLPRRWFYEGDLDNPQRQYIAKESIPVSQIQPINWDTIPLSDDWRDDYRETYIDGLAYTVLQPPVPRDSVEYYAQFDDYADTTFNDKASS